ncbi:hypothetical protein JVW24_20355, partial [Vibrio cholerae O1]|nr:hypothetical protein [Vibrio cholerae O1]
VPATALYVASRIDSDDGVKEAISLAAGRGISMLEASRADLDRLPAGAAGVRSESQNPCRDLGERVTVFRTDGTEPTAPSAARTASGQAPSL